MQLGQLGRMSLRPKAEGLTNREVIFSAAAGPVAGAAYLPPAPDDRDFVVFCFSNPEDAETPAERFSGKRLATGGRR